MKNILLIEELVDASLWSEPLPVRVLFVTMLGLRGDDHVVRLADHKICQRARITEQEFLAALKILKSPDRKSKIEQPHGGRRIQKTSEGWLILNGEIYAQRAAEMMRRSIWAQQKRDSRAKAKAETQAMPPTLQGDAST